MLHEAATPQVEQLGVQQLLLWLVRRALRPPNKLLPQHEDVPQVSQLEPQAGAAGTSFSTHLATLWVPLTTSQRGSQTVTQRVAW